MPYLSVPTLVPFVSNGVTYHLTPSFLPNAEGYATLPSGLSSQALASAESLSESQLSFFNSANQAMSYLDAA
eukprot:EC849447.1.p1 GENE.EC849447.1~~EC849447.1.p1  ORF type:complete len:72 (+),score=10.60 EC849447.1:36-251(+)